MILPAFAAAQSTTTSTSTSSAASTSTSAGTIPPMPGGQDGRGWGPFQAGPFGGPFAPQAAANLTVGQTITITSTSGQYFEVGDRAVNGTASGSLTFTVAGKLAGGYILSISSGSVVVNGATYTVSSGSAQMDRAASHLVGQGATSSSGAFLVSATAHGSFAGTTATMSLDLTSGSTEYLVFLSGTTTG